MKNHFVFIIWFWKSFGTFSTENRLKQTDKKKQTKNEWKGDCETRAKKKAEKYYFENKVKLKSRSEKNLKAAINVTNEEELRLEMNSHRDQTKWSGSRTKKDEIDFFYFIFVFSSSACLILRWPATPSVERRRQLHCGAWKFTHVSGETSWTVLKFETSWFTQQQQLQQTTVFYKYLNFVIYYYDNVIWLGRLQSIRSFTSNGQFCHQFLLFRCENYLLVLS